MTFKLSSLLLFSALSFGLCSCLNRQHTENDNKAVVVRDWGVYKGQAVKLFTLTNGKGSKISVSNYGGTLTQWTFPDKKGDTSNLIIGFDSLSVYLQKPPYFGALIGRYGNRIAKGKFKLDGKDYTLATNDGPNHLHGGINGFDKVIWNVTVPDSTKPELVLHYTSADGEEGYPGNLSVTVHYILTEDNALKIIYDASTDKPTPINLTNHTYFNLSGNLANTILGEKIYINASNYTPVKDLIPTGRILPVKNTPFDFTKPYVIGARIAQVPGGYDHNFVLNTKGDISALAAEVTDSISGRTLKVYTTQPGLQFYTGNFLDGTFMAHGNQPTILHSGLCLESQHFPDSPNQPAFPSVILRPGEKYHQEAIYQVSL